MYEHIDQCQLCDGTGFTYTTRPSPHSALDTEYAIACRCSIGKQRSDMINRRFTALGNDGHLTTSDHVPRTETPASR